MKPEARDLRELARAIEEITRQSPAYSMAWTPVIALSDYLQLQARIMELHELINDDLSPRKETSNETPL
jgi:hypothetical protein